MTSQTPAAATAAAKGTSTGAALSGPGVKACVLGHPVYLTAVIGVVLGASGYHALMRWRKNSKSQVKAT